jgi:hypothetical protein
MSTSSLPETPDPEAVRLSAKIRLLMLISGLTTVVAIGAVLFVIGYRVFKAEGSAVVADASLALPQGSRVLNTAIGEGRIALTLDTGRGIEVHMFDLKTLKPLGRLKLETQ